MHLYRSTKRRIVWTAILFIASALSLALLIITKQTINAGALWSIVHDRCLPGMEKDNNPSPCVSVDLSRGESDGFVVLKDDTGNTQYLLIPTGKIAGIESSAILDPGSPNYFAEAWAATSLVNRKLHFTLPRTDFALAINSVSGRSQNQLHIHVDCIQPKIRLALTRIEPEIGAKWQTLPVNLARHVYRAMWLPGTDLGDRNPFQLLAESLHHPAQEMGRHTLVLVGDKRDGQDGFILLDSQAPYLAAAIAPWLKLGLGSGEELEDHKCHIADNISSSGDPTRNVVDSRQIR